MKQANDFKKGQRVTYRVEWEQQGRVVKVEYRHGTVKQVTKHGYVHVSFDDGEGRTVRLFDQYLNDLEAEA